MYFVEYSPVFFTISPPLTISRFTGAVSLISRTLVLQFPHETRPGKTRRIFYSLTGSPLEPLPGDHHSLLRPSSAFDLFRMEHSLCGPLFWRRGNAQTSVGGDQGSVLLRKHIVGHTLPRHSLLRPGLLRPPLYERWKRKPDRGNRNVLQFYLFPCLA